MKTVKLIVSLFIALVYSLVIFAEPVGTLTMASGILKLRRNMMDTIYKDPGLRVPVENGDEIQTGFKTRVTIKFTEKQETIELFQNTFFTVSAVTADETALSMPVGKASFRIERPKKLTRRKKRRFGLRTANAVIGVKGTHFVAAVVDGNTNLLTIEGIVSMANIEAPEVAVLVKQNQASVIKGDKGPSIPVAVPPEIRRQIVESDGAASFGEVVYGDDDAEEERSEDADAEEEKADEEADDEMDTLIEDVKDAAEQAEEDALDSVSNRRSIEIKIVDQ